MAESRIPFIPMHVGYEGMLQWFQQMADKGLLFHPDDDPITVVRCDGERWIPTFTSAEATQLRGILKNLFADHGDRVYEAALAASGFAEERE